MLFYGKPHSPSSYTRSVSPDRFRANKVTNGFSVCGKYYSPHSRSVLPAIARCTCNSRCIKHTHTHATWSAHAVVWVCIVWSTILSSFGRNPAIWQRFLPILTQNEPIFTNFFKFGPFCSSLFSRPWIIRLVLNFCPVLTQLMMN